MATERIVAIVGRPNVGKSALFNRLVHRRVAIVHEKSGITRDRLVCKTEWDGHSFDLIDTGGISSIDGSAPEDIINEGIVKQASVAIEDAKVLILVVDVKAGLLPLDHEVARLLYKSGHTVFVAANKADNEKLDLAVSEFGALGFPVFPVSALHNRGLKPLLNKVVKQLPKEKNPSVKNPLKVAVIGRPNVGKSSYINSLLRNERIIVSDLPGTTIDSVEVPFQVGDRHYILMDTAGIKKRGKIRDVLEHFSMIRAERSIERADVAVLMLDAEQGLCKSDKKMAAMVFNKKKGCITLVNKWDLAEGKITQRQYSITLRKALPSLDYVPVIYASATSGYNIRRSVEAIDYVATQISTEITTGVLNRVIQEAHKRVPPPQINKHRLKIYYATQTGIRPVRIQLFVNTPRRMTSTYRAYLVNVLRKRFGLEGAPIFLFCKARSA